MELKVKSWFRSQGMARYVIVAILFFALGYFSFSLRSSNAPATISQPLQLGRSGFINPLLAFAVPQNLTELKSLTNSLQIEVDSETRSGSITDIGIYFRDLDKAYWTGIHPDEKFSPASLLKVPTMITYLRRAERDPGILNEKLTYDGSFDDNAREDIKPLKAIEAGHSYTISDLIKFMIEYSDNNATTLLYNHLAPDEFSKTYTDLGVPLPTSADDFMSSRNLSLFFRVLYNATYLNPDLSEKAIEFLAYPDFPAGLSAGVPEGIIVAQKFGEHAFPDGTKELHDCGIVYNAKHPYFLCVMTKGNDFIKLTNVVQKVSLIVYQSVESDYKN